MAVSILTLAITGKGQTMKNISIIAMALWLAACTSSRVKDQASVSKIKKVAIVAFTVTEPQGAKISLNIGKGLESAPGGSHMTETSPHIDSMYTSLGENLRSKLKWQVVDLKDLKAHPAYKIAYKNTMEGWQNKMPTGQGLQDYEVEGLMDWNGLRLLKQEGREQLIQALGVDAIIMAKSYVVLDGVTVLGIGDKYPKAHVSLEIYGKGQEDPIWREVFTGEKSEKSVGKTAFIDSDILKESSLKSFKSAAAHIGDSKE